MLINEGEGSVDLPALLGDVELDLQLLLLQLIAVQETHKKLQTPFLGHHNKVTINNKRKTLGFVDQQMDTEGACVFYGPKKP
jgi:hypothetical protein